MSKYNHFIDIKEKYVDDIEWSGTKRNHFGVWATYWVILKMCFPIKKLSDVLLLVRS